MFTHKKLLTHILIVIPLLIFSASKVFAVTEFDTNFENIYQFDQSGNVNVIHKIELINNLSHIYPTVYNLALNSSEIENIEVSVQSATVKADVEKTLGLTTLHIPIANPAIGKAQKTLLEVKYKSTSFAEKIGDTYTLTLPKTQKGNEATSFVRQVIIPDDFPELSYSSITPQATEKIESNSQRSYRFIGHGSDTLTLHFGKSATYDVSLKYQLKNTTSIAATTEIALPPDTPYQKVYLHELEPKPLEIVVDPDGNWLARYQLAPLEKRTVTANLSLTVTNSPLYFDPSISSPLGESKYWQRNQAINRLAEQLKTPKNIYDYLTSNLSYDYTNINEHKRLGAEKALESPNSAICTEFSDLFVTLARSSSIPARSLIGYAYSQNQNQRPQATAKDILHAFAEYYDSSQKKWIAIDPTWGHTTHGSEYFDRLDFAHLVFVRWGLESDYPLPAGSYITDSIAKQLNITIRKENLENASPEFTVEKTTNGDYIINTGHTAIINTDLTVENTKTYVKYLPPFGKHRLNNQSIIKSWQKYSNLYLLGLIFIIVWPVIAYLKKHKTHVK
ncbi:MAG: transglutaminase domain-containing protein [Candidatus Moraniibacteriota bacterium]|nr:MAG: transglutaminase domain-containing protein [Candidatus Moranbacteria bacterium]